MTESNSLLEGCRILDLTDEKGIFAGKVLGDFGADVIKIEKPGGDPARKIGPFYKDIEDPEKSLFWFAANTSKRGITLDIETPEGQEIFKKLAKTADIVIESFKPGYMDSIGLGYCELKEIKPDIILTSITGFGQTGPYAQYETTDLIGTAMGGLARILGDLGTAPIRMGYVSQAHFHAGIQGALGSVMAYYHRELTGEGQQVDVSMQDAVSLTLMNAVEIFELLGANLVGMGQFFISVRPEPVGILFTRMINPCKDGSVLYMFGGGAFGGTVDSSKELVKWANEEGKVLELKDFDFATQWDASNMTQEECDYYHGFMQEFVKNKTKAELYERAVKNRIMLAPCNTVEDVTNDAQLKARGFWEEVEHPELDTTITYPGAPLKMEDTPWKIQRRAPLIGEHNQEIYESLGFSAEEIEHLKTNGIV
ncbi:MAG: CoA transferase [Chloroflexi bacterium]|nr:CoA transferase [Chloroflexota bacterium]